MFKIAHAFGTEVKEAEFNDYLDLIEYVALNRIDDRDLISLDLEEDHISGINGLASFALNKVQAAREARAELEAMMAAMDSEMEVA